MVELVLAMFALGVASMTLGLLLSSLVDTSDKAMPLLVVVVMFQVVLSGGIFPLHGKVGLRGGRPGSRPRAGATRRPRRR